MNPKARKKTGKASWTVHHEFGENLWYVALDERVSPPYRRQIHVAAIIDLDENGQVAGIEIVDPAMPAPPGGFD